MLIEPRVRKVGSGMDIVAHPHLELAVVALDGDIEHGGDRLPDDRPANGTTR